MHRRAFSASLGLIGLVCDPTGLCIKVTGDLSCRLKMSWALTRNPYARQLWRQLDEDRSKDAEVMCSNKSYWTNNSGQHLIEWDPDHFSMFVTGAIIDPSGALMHELAHPFLANLSNPSSHAFILDAYERPWGKMSGLGARQSYDEPSAYLGNDPGFEWTGPGAGLSF